MSVPLSFYVLWNFHLGSFRTTLTIAAPNKVEIVLVCVTYLNWGLVSVQEHGSQHSPEKRTKMILKISGTLFWNLITREKNFDLHKSLL